MLEAKHNEFIIPFSSDEHATAEAAKLDSFGDADLRVRAHVCADRCIRPSARFARSILLRQQVAGINVRGTSVARPQSVVRVGCGQDNALEAWPEHDLLGAQVGPIKHGRKP